MEDVVLETASEPPSRARAQRRSTVPGHNNRAPRKRAAAAASTSEASKPKKLATAAKAAEHPKAFLVYNLPIKPPACPYIACGIATASNPEDAKEIAVLGAARAFGLPEPESSTFHLSTIGVEQIDTSKPSGHIVGNGRPLYQGAQSADGMAQLASHTSNINTYRLFVSTDLGMLNSPVPHVAYSVARDKVQARSLINGFMQPFCASRPLMPLQYNADMPLIEVAVRECGDFVVLADGSPRALAMG